MAYIFLDESGDLGFKETSSKWKKKFFFLKISQKENPSL